MSKFHSRFNVAPSLNKDKVYDRHDNVNRVSYVDSTQLVRRFIMEGKNLNAARAAALRHGMYDGDETDVNEPFIPVYDLDPAVAMPIIDAAKQSLNSRISEAKRKRSESSAKDNSELTGANHDDKGESVS